MESNFEITNEFVMQTVTKGKQYSAYFYKAGPNSHQIPAEPDELQMAHLRHLFTLRAQGKLVINGPVVDGGPLLGIGIFDTTDVEEVKRYLDGDPAVQAGRLVYEIHPWFSIPGDSLP